VTERLVFAAENLVGRGKGLLQNKAGSAGSYFQFSLFRANEKNKTAPGRETILKILRHEVVTRRSKLGKLIVAAVPLLGPELPLRAGR
jgi:hypothetical protein